MIYLYIFESKLLTISLGFVFAFFSVATVTRFKRSLSTAFRFLLYSFTGVFASGFMASIFFSNIPVNILDLLSSLAIEVAILFFTVVFFCVLLKFDDKNYNYNNYLLYISLVILVINSPLVLASSFGLFSSGSRLSYLGENPLFKYLTFATILLIGFMSVLVSRQLQSSGKVNTRIFIAFATIFIMSVISASKGMFFVFILQVIALIDYKRMNVSLSRVLVYLLIILILFIGSMILISEFLMLSYEQFINLVFSRFFLTNDARALAFDFRSSIHDRSLDVFIAESFRSFSSLLGWKLSYPPIGNYLFSLQKGSLTDDGANASLVALATLYSKDGEAILCYLLVIALPLLITAFSCVALYFDRHVPRQLFIISGSIVCLSQFSQDFLSFQLSLFVFVVFYLFWLFIDYLMKFTLEKVLM